MTDDSNQYITFLQRKRADFAKRLYLGGQFLNNLLQAEVITTDQYNEIQAVQGPEKNKIEKLLDILEKRSIRNLTDFFIELKKDGEALAGAEELLKEDPVLYFLSEKPAIAVFAGELKDTNKCLERVIAAPVTPHGLGGGYTQVEAIPEVPHPRREAAVVRYKGEVWLIGGLGEDGKTLGVCDVLDLASWQWRQGAPNLMSPRCNHTVTEVGGVMVAVGGSDGSKDLSSVETLVSESDWRPGPDLPEVRSRHAACEWNGRVWVSGGFGDAVRKSVNNVMSFCPGEDGWRQETSHTEWRYGHTMAGIGRDRMLVFGGLTDSVEEYNSESRTWSWLTDRIPASMSRSSLIVYGQARYIVGGQFSTRTLRYDGHWHKEQHRLPQMRDTVACLIELP